MSRISPVHVGLSMLTFVPGEMGGGERYAVELARALPAAGVDITALVGPDGGGAFESTRTVVAAGYPRGAGAGAKLRRLAHAALRPGPLRDALAGVDVVHYPFTVAAPSFDVPWVTTLHDLQHRDLPQLFSRADRVYRARAYDRAARRARVVVVPSEFVRERAIEMLGLEPNRVVVVPHGVDHDRFQPGADEREPFLLYPARPWPHKNHEQLLAALPLVRATRPELRLVLTGGGHAGVAPKGVEVRGAVSDAELASLYRRAACLVFPSLYEGFGLPVLEAMACGCPVAASSRGAIREVCGDAAVLFEPEDAEAVAAGVLQALDRGAELGERGRERAAAYTWARSAEGHAAVYRAVVA
jgi:glycosyltransferase involved in cell wall biosynthesis